MASALETATSDTVSIVDVSQREPTRANVTSQQRSLDASLGATLGQPDPHPTEPER